MKRLTFNYVNKICSWRTQPRVLWFGAQNGSFPLGCALTTEACVSLNNQISLIWLIFSGKIRYLNVGLWCKFLPGSWLYIIGSRWKVANSDLIFLWRHWCSQTSHVTHGLGITVHSDGWMIDPEVTFVVAPFIFSRHLYQRLSGVTWRDWILIPHVMNWILIQKDPVRWIWWPF